MFPKELSKRKLKNGSFLKTVSECLWNKRFFEVFKEADRYLKEYTGQYLVFYSLKYGISH